MEWMRHVYYTIPKHVELERAQARARKSGLNAGPALHKPKARAQYPPKPAGFDENLKE